MRLNGAKLRVASIYGVRHQPARCPQWRCCIRRLIGGAAPSTSLLLTQVTATEKPQCRIANLSRVLGILISDMGLETLPSQVTDLRLAAAIIADKRTIFEREFKSSRRHMPTAVPIRANQRPQKGRGDGSSRPCSHGQRRNQPQLLLGRPAGRLNCQAVQHRGGVPCERRAIGLRWQIPVLHGPFEPLA